jgi:DNA-binding transcriptional MerR regulator
MVSKRAEPLRSKRHTPAKAAGAGEAFARSLKIGEAAKLLGVEAYVLRFWETQFPNLRPYHTETKHRLYRPQDVEVLRLIKQLLYEEGFTIEGARKRIKELNAGGAHQHPKAAAAPVPKSMAAPKATPAPSGPALETLLDIRRDLQSLYQLLKD